jgi:c-di-GMP-binding flagellar brake protein YcgR
MLKERRRYFRQPVKMQVKVVLDGKTLKATSTNISEGGIALMLEQPLPKGAIPVLKFALPQSDIRMEVEAEVAWTDVKGLAGFRFHHIPKSSQQELEHWLDERIEEEFPGTKERMSASDSNDNSH